MLGWRGARRQRRPGGFLIRVNRVDGLLVAVAVAMLGLDVTAAVLGLWTRPVADSWCTAVQVRDGGVLSTAWHMYAHLNGRLASAFANSVSGLHRGAAERLFPGITVLMAMACYGGLFAGVRRVALVRLRRLDVAVLAVTATAGTVLLGRSAYQSFLWAPGATTHTWPPLLACLVVGIGLRVAGGAGGRAWIVLGAVLAFAASTFEEVTPVLLLTIAGVVLLDRRAWTGRPSAWVTYVRAGVAGTVAGLLVLVVSPGFHSRSGGSHAGIGVLAGSVVDVGRWLVDFLTQWPLVALVGVAVAVGLRGGSGAGRAPLPRRLLAAPAVVTLVALVVDVAALRAGYGATGPQITPRAFSEFFVPAVVATAFYSLLLGRWLAQRAPAGQHRGRTMATAVVLGAAVLVGIAGLALQSQHLARVLTTRASAWDAQNARIARATHGGAVSVRYTPLPVAGLADPFWLAGYHDWVAGCVKSYYRVSQLRAGRYVR